MAFRPNVNDILQLGNHTYQFTEHPSAPGIPYGQTGRRATVYQIQTNGAYYALKVFTQAFRSPRVAAGVKQLRPFAGLPGLQVCAREVITPEQHARTLKQHPDLAYAVLMSWVQGETWQEFLLDGRPLRAEQSQTLAQQWLDILLNMEQRQIAHCDLSGPNVIIDFSTLQVILIDVEDLYAPGLERPEKLPGGSEGYAHKTAPQGLWSVDADRFAGAVLLAEILGWCDERVRRIAYGEQYFDPSEIQKNGSERYRILHTSLRERWGVSAAEAFAQAWHSERLSDCPSFADWTQLLSPASKPEEPEAKEQKVGEHIKGEGGDSGLWRSEPEGLDTLRSRGYVLAGQGQWREVLQICEHILDRWPAESDITLLRIKAQRLLEMENELEIAWTRAMQSARAEDWQACWEKAQTALQQSPKVERYQEIVERARQEVTWTALVAKAELLATAQQWEDAEALLETIPLDHPAAASVRARISIARSQERELADLLTRVQEQIAQREWQKAQRTCQTALALGGSVDVFDALLQKIAEGRKIDRQITQLVNESDQAAAMMNWETALARIDEALTFAPDHPDLLTRRAPLLQNYEWAFQLKQAITSLTQHDYDNALMLLEPLPQDFMNVGILHQQAQQQIEYRNALESARLVFDSARVLTLLEQNPNSPFATEALRRWAETENARTQELQKAQQQYDGQRILELLTDAPSDYPGLETLRRLAEDEIRRQDTLESARRDYNTERVETLLETLPANHPLLNTGNKWLTQERERQMALAMTKQTYNLEGMTTLLTELPPDYPQADDLRQWLQDEQARAIHLESARQNYDGEQVLVLLQDVASNYPDMETWRHWATTEITRHQQLVTARATYNGEQVLALLEEVQPDYPDLEKWRNWAKVEIERRRNLERALSSYDCEQVLRLLADVPSDYPNLEQLRAWAEAQQVLHQRLAAVQAIYDFEGALTLAAELPPEHPGLAGLQSWLEVERQRREDLATAHADENWEKLLALVETLPSDYPDLEDLRAEAETGQQLQHYLAELYDKTITALAQHEWQHAIASCDTALALRNELRFEELRKQAEREWWIDQDVEQALSEAETAHAAGDLDIALARLEQAIALRPEREELQSQQVAISQKIQRRNSLWQAQQAVETQQWTTALDSLNTLPEDDPEAVALRAAVKQGQIQELQTRAEVAEKAGQWDKAIAAVETLVQLRGPEENLTQWIQQLRLEQAVAAEVTQVQDAIEHQRWQAAITAAEAAEQRFAGRTEFATLLATAQSGLAAWKARRRRALVIALIIGALLLISGGILAWGKSTGGGPAGSLFWTVTPTIPPTATPTATATATALPTATPTSTSTPTRTPTPTPTRTSTPTATPTHTPTPTTTPTLRPTPRPPTPTFTPIPPTATNTPEPPPPPPPPTEPPPPTDTPAPP